MQISHQPEAGRFHATIDGHDAKLTYRLDGDRITIEHTGVPSAIGGRGVAADLVKAALDFARSEGLKVVPACSYAASYIQRHTAYADLLA